MTNKSMTNKSKQQRTAFTLVEVLVVTVIISILMALVSGAIWGALEHMKMKVISFEAMELESAMTALQNRYNTGPPPADLRNPADQNSDIYKFVQRTFPRYQITNLQVDLNAEQIVFGNFDPGYSLVFWLVGFSGDPSNPFRGHYQRMQGRDLTEVVQPWEFSNAFYKFDEDRLVDGHYFPEMSVYYSDTDDDGQFDQDTNYDDASGTFDAGDAEAYDAQTAFLYYDADSYVDSYDPAGGGALPTFAAAYRTTSTGAYFNSGGIQIINAGLDRRLGYGGSPLNVAVPPVAADGEPFLNEDADNVTNFADGTMGDYTDK